MRKVPARLLVHTTTNTTTTTTTTNTTTNTTTTTTTMTTKMIADLNLVRVEESSAVLTKSRYVGVGFVVQQARAKDITDGVHGDVRNYVIDTGATEARVVDLLGETEQFEGHLDCCWL